MKELINLFKAATVVDDKVAPIATVDPKFVQAFNLELGSMGYTLSSSLMAALSRLSEQSFTDSRRAILSPLATANNINVTLFANFPYNVPDQDNYLMQRIVSFFYNEDLKEMAESIVLSCGHAIYKGFFDLNEFGVCPVCQCAVPELRNEGTGAKFDYSNITPLTILEYADAAFLRSAVVGLFSRQSSLSEAEKTFLKTYAKIEDYNIAKVFKETLPILYTFTQNKQTLAPQISGLTDILRIVSYLSDEEADLSLKENTKFYLTTSQKKAIIRLIEASIHDPQLAAEDIMRHRERWLRVAKMLAVASEYNKSHYPKTAGVFDTIRNSKKTVHTFARYVESHVRSGGMDRISLNVLATRPAEFARRLDSLLRSERSDRDAVLELFKNTVVGGLTTKLLFELQSFFKNRLNTNLVAKPVYTLDDLTKESIGSKSKKWPSKNPPKDFNANRIFFPKGNTNNTKVIPDNRRNYNTDIETHINQVLVDIDNELTARVRQESNMGKVYIDKALRGVLVPFNRRGDSGSSKTLTKGSRYPFMDGGCVRLFIYWKGNIDVDLSALAMDDELNTITQVSFTNLYDSGFTHSGDIQSAPKGAAEYIDIELAKINPKIRYIAMSAISYRGETFTDFPCFAGFMNRDDLKSGEKFEPASVALKFDITHSKQQVMPLIFDVKTKEIVYLDMAVGGGRGGSVQSAKYREMIEAFLNLNQMKPTVYDVLLKNASIRGELVFTPEEADIVFDVNTNIDEILSASGI